MKIKKQETNQILRIAGWFWLGYLTALVLLDLYLYGRPVFPILSSFYVVNIICVLIFLGLTYLKPLLRQGNVLYQIFMIIYLAVIPIISIRVWLPRLPPGPLSNVEGSSLRLLPILFIGLLVAAWLYDWPGILLFAVGSAVLEMTTVFFAERIVSLSAGNAIFSVSIIRSISFLVVGLFIHRLMERIKEQQRDLTEANRRLKHYASTLESLTVSRERNRMSRELHDTVVHTLSGLSVQLETAKAYWDVEPETAARLLTQSLEAARNGLQETRRALKSLRAAPLEDLGLRLAVEQLCAQARERGKLTVDLDWPGQDLVLPPDLEQSLYRIFQEALENAIHHANADHLIVSLKRNETQLILTVSDDGHGFDPAVGATPGHYGLTGIRERAALSGATITINSKPGQGTTIQCTVTGIPE